MDQVIGLVESRHGLRRILNLVCFRLRDQILILDETLSERLNLISFTGICDVLRSIDQVVSDGLTLLLVGLQASVSLPGPSRKALATLACMSAWDRPI
ncbi:MAG: hypothetical protein JOZ87_16410 [Chloroflexi bacterium]|nr:hypothetical protein [Chloroflexota bacterium]